MTRVENSHQAVREFARLLRPGGGLIVTVPNILNIEGRFKWLLRGYTSHFKPLSREHLREEYGGMEEIALHVNPAGYAELRYALEPHGFETVALHRDKPKSHLWAYWPAALLVRLLARLTPESKRRARWTAELRSDEALLGGNTLIVHARKRPADEAAP